jgi:hypothetical protein
MAAAFFPAHHGFMTVPSGPLCYAHDNFNSIPNHDPSAIHGNPAARCETDANKN